MNTEIPLIQFAIVACLATPVVVKRLLNPPDTGVMGALMKTNLELWATFLLNEKLEPSRIGDAHYIMELVRLAENLAYKQGPKIRPHLQKLLSRELVCETAMDLGIYLPYVKTHKGKTAMGRGLLDAWNKVYQKRHGSTVGTAGAKEATRRDIKTKLTRVNI